MNLPPIFQQYEPLVSNIRQVSDTEWSSSCPICQGDDRCRWFTRGASPCGWCRVAGHLFFPDQAPGYKPPTADELAKWTQERIQAEEARKRSAERALANLRDGKLWERYHEQMTEQGRVYWEKRGVPRAYQDWWQLGWNEHFTFYCDGQRYERQSATIPLFGPDWTPLNIKHRIIDPPRSSDKYRPEISGQPQPLFLCDPEKPLTGEIYVIEGEVKSQVVAVTLDNGPQAIVGLPGITPPKEGLDLLKGADSILLVTDPGSREQTWKMVKYLGKEKCRVLIPSRGKCDDLILESGMTGNELRSLFRQAIPAA